MQRALRAICGEEGFDGHLEGTLQRINDIESLGRTREIVAKDLVLGGKYKVTMGMGQGKGKGRGERVVEVVLEEKKEDEDGD